eukprot:1139155-Pelagomonas_calceolata.AAC.2
MAGGEFRSLLTISWKDARGDLKIMLRQPIFTSYVHVNQACSPRAFAKSFDDHSSSNIVAFKFHAGDDMICHVFRMLNHHKRRIVHLSVIGAIKEGSKMKNMPLSYVLINTSASSFMFGWLFLAHVPDVLQWVLGTNTSDQSARDGGFRLPM